MQRPPQGGKDPPSGTVCGLVVGNGAVLAGGSDGKPYEKSLWLAPQLKEELVMLPQGFLSVSGPFLKSKTRLDDLHDMIVVYYDLKRTCSGRRLKKKFAQRFTEKARETSRSNWINGSWRNISLNQCYGDGKYTAADWLNLEKEEA